MLNPRLLLPLILLPASLPGQGPADPPAFLRLIRSTVRPSCRSDMLLPYRRSRPEVHVFGGETISGASEVWLLETHDTYASLEALDQRLQTSSYQHLRINTDAADDLVTSAKSMIAVYHAAWSYHPETALRNLATARYLQAFVYRYRPGSDSTFSTLMDNRRRAFESIGSERAELCYRVTSGAESGTILLLTPLTSLAQLDRGQTRGPAYTEALTESLSANRQIMSDILYSREGTLLRLSPYLSYVSNEFAEADAEFWRPARRDP